MYPCIDYDLLEAFLYVINPARANAYPFHQLCFNGGHTQDLYRCDYTSKVQTARCD
jgi:hypothetical protein